MPAFEAFGLKGPELDPLPLASLDIEAGRFDTSSPPRHRAHRHCGSRVEARRLIEGTIDRACPSSTWSERPKWLNLSSVIVAITVLATTLSAGDGLAQTQAPPPAVTVAKPVVKDVIEHDDYTGRFNAVEFVEVRARVTGYLAQINFKDGAFVKKGDVLFVIDRRPYQATLDGAKAALASTQARVSFSGTDLKRARTLTSSGYITEQTTDQRLQTAQTAQADLDNAQATLTQATLNLDFTEVRAPITGKIGQRLVTEGNIVVADTTKLTTIVSLDPIYFSFTVDERSFLDYQRTLKIGMEGGSAERSSSVLIALTGEDKPTHKGVLDFVDNSVDDATGSILLRATVENHEDQIKPGLFGVVSMPASESYKGILIPDDAVVTNQDKRIVYVVADDGTATAREVRLGGKIDGYRIVRKGLDGTERIVIAGLTRVRPGAKVAPELKELLPSRL